MIFQLLQPAIRLQAYIKHYRLIDFVFDPKHPCPVKPFPASTDHYMVFYLKGRINALDPVAGVEQQFPKIAINGPQTSRLDFSLPADYRMLGVNFQPGVLAKFLRLPLTEFTDQCIDAESILNPGINVVYERLLHSPDQGELITVLEDYLWQRIQKMAIGFQPIDRVSQMMLKNKELGLHNLADAACLSVSQFERRFLQQTGITPKLYTRIHRFSSAFLLKDSDPGLSWFEVACRCGYYDYQHLVKDFKAFAGNTPNSLMLAQAQAPERLLGMG